MFADHYYSLDSNSKTASRHRARQCSRFWCCSCCCLRCIYLHSTMVFARLHCTWTNTVIIQVRHDCLNSLFAHLDITCILFLISACFVLFICSDMTLIRASDETSLSENNRHLANAQAAYHCFRVSAFTLPLATVLVFLDFLPDFAPSAIADADLISLLNRFIDGLSFSVGQASSSYFISADNSQNITARMIAASQSFDQSEIASILQLWAFALCHWLSLLMGIAVACKGGGVVRAFFHWIFFLTLLLLSCWIDCSVWCPQSLQSYSCLCIAIDFFWPRLISLSVMVVQKSLTFLRCCASLLGSIYFILLRSAENRFGASQQQVDPLFIIVSNFSIDCSGCFLSKCFVFIFLCVLLRPLSAASLHWCDIHKHYKHRMMYLTSQVCIILLLCSPSFYSCFCYSSTSKRFISSCWIMHSNQTLQ